MTAQEMIRMYNAGPYSKAYIEMLMAMDSEYVTLEGALLHPEQYMWRNGSFIVSGWEGFTS